MSFVMNARRLPQRLEVSSSIEDTDDNIQIKVSLHHDPGPFVHSWLASSGR